MGDGQGFWSVCLFLSVFVGFVGTLCCGVERLFAFSFPLFLGYSLGFLGCVFLWAMSGPCCVLGAQEF